MSSFAYGVITSVRNAAESGTSKDVNPPGVKTFVDALASLVPAEVLVAHAVILSKATKLVEDEDGKAMTTITEPGVLRGTFWALVLAAAFVYVGGRIAGARSREPQKKLDWSLWDIARAAIPALAFVGWTMLQSPTAFDALGLGWGDAMRTAIAVVGGLALGGAAAMLGYEVDKKTSK